MSGEELDEISFPNEELEKIIHETIEAELGNKTYEEKATLIFGFSVSDCSITIHFFSRYFSDLERDF